MPKKQQEAKEGEKMSIPAGSNSGNESSATDDLIVSKR